MRIDLKKIVATLFISISTLSLFGQAYYQEIQRFKRADSLSFPAANQILFIGSSTFTNWKDVQQDFPGFNIINRGFGGSKLTDQIFYANEILFPYQPKQIVIYCGENDLNKETNGDIVFERFKELYYLIRKQLPKTPILYISLKPSPFKRPHMEELQKANHRIAAFIKKTGKRIEYLDMYSLMMVNDTDIMPHIFLSDSLHMNRAGYDIWKKAIEPKLKK
ncbi:GDSL-type esterase/lipase family protein [Gynurincola endophyticus]|jgi:lysophospholipase L1-like esterase|uniref:GDSL-type esterase/lipase family protein n=1 Tax=Gynurincola endophyticus TaxID=2479004 RepID=UPI000F8C34EE|nr:GDSL-type esterase/lipase family protein [Gynurincola endophyticus]